MAALQLKMCLRPLGAVRAKRTNMYLRVAGSGEIAHTLVRR